MAFNIRAYLEDKGIPYKTTGKNVSRGWLEINCPFPLCSDPSYHMGISPQLRFSCWKCGARGPLTKLLEQFEGTTHLRKVFQQYGDYEEIVEEEQEPKGKLILPTEADFSFSEDHYNFLTSRRFDPLYITQKYRLRVCHNVGDFKFRFIIPIIIDNVMVSYVGMDWTRKQTQKYKNAPARHSTVSAKQCLYNLDSVKDVAVVVEGITDVWRGGDGFVGTLGIQWTKEQAALLVRKNPSRVFVMFDAEDEAQERARALARTLSGVLPSVELLELSEGDPDNMTDEEVENFRREYKI
jgi:hypothetical protein